MRYKHKIVTSGNIIELYSYEKEVRTGKDAERENNNGRKGNKDTVGKEWIYENEEKNKNRSDSLQKARKRLRREINANVGQWEEETKFITLTYAENMQDLKSSNYNFKKFIQRLNYQLDIKLKYSCVVEFQKRGAIHYHLLAYNLPYIENSELAKIWSHGFVKINNIDNVDNVGAYVTKYMTKDNDDPRLVEQKCHFSSRGLKKSQEAVIDEKEIETLKESLKAYKVYEAEFDTDYLGRIEYQQINLKR